MTCRCGRFTFALSALTGVVFGLAPAVSLSSDRSAHALHEGKPAVFGTNTFQQRRIQSVLVVTEIALAMTLFLAA